MAENKYPEPEIGRSVRFVLGTNLPGEGKIRPATIVMVHENDLVNLNAMVGAPSDLTLSQQESGITNLLVLGVKMDPTKAPGTWHWPEHAVQAGKPKGADAPAEAKK